MSDPGVTVAIPVGPEQHHQRWLGECLASVRQQTHPADEVLLIDDMAGLEDREGCRIWRAHWRLGAAHAINFGVALAKNDLVYILCADDWLEPECLAACVEEYGRRNDSLGYYHVTIRFRPEGDYQHPGRLPDPPIQDLPCGAAMTTKQLWRKTGGFPMEAGGSPDSCFISILLGWKKIGNLYHVRQGVPLCNIRMHAEQDSATRGSWLGVIHTARDLLTKEWKQPEWGRYR